VGTQVFDAQVLIVGAGPVGAILALELAHHGVASVVVERSATAPRHPDLVCLNERSMELLRRLGLASLIREHSLGPDRPIDVAWTQGLDQPPVLVWHHPSVNQLRARYADVNDGTAPVEASALVHGAALTAQLRDAARRHPLVDLREGWTFTDLRVQPDGVVATVFEAARGERHLVEARYLAGCDGAQSTVRKCLGIAMDDLAAPAQHCSVSFKSADPALRRHGKVFSTITAKGLTLVSCDEADTWVCSVPVPGSGPMTTNPMTLVQERLGVRFEVQLFLGATQWVGSLAVAEAYRQGPVFLAGDSAHRFHTDGGHSANTGVTDAVDLGWKLAAVLTGWGGAGLLASYELERRSHALQDRELSSTVLETRQRFARLSAVGASREFLAGIVEHGVRQTDGIGVQFGRRYATSPVICHESGTPPRWSWRTITPTTWPGVRAPAVRLADGSQLFDLFGPNFTLVDLTRNADGAPLVRHARRRGVPVTHLHVPDPAIRACWQRRLVLVRPDHHIAWRGNRPPDDWAAVLDLVSGQKTP
jgi:2-polyprenyl-6-methoxyphenol hydroxylase-like FAD-dependent oxidoreductase